MAARLAPGCARGLVCRVESDKADHMSSPGLCACFSVHAISHPIARALPHIEDYNRAINTRVLWSLVASVTDVCHAMSWFCLQLFRNTFVLASSLLSTLCKLRSSGKKEPPIRKCLCRMGLSASLWGVFLLNEWCWRALPTVGIITPRLVVLSALRKQSEQDTRSQPVSRAPCDLGFLWPWTVM